MHWQEEVIREGFRRLAFGPRLRRQRLGDDDLLVAPGKSKEEFTNAELARRISSTIAPTLQSAGFKKRRNSFNRLMDDGIVHVTSLQVGQYPLSVEHSDARQRLGVVGTYWGQFTVNVGVRISAMTRNRPAAGSWINEYNCDLRWRLSQLYGVADFWWDLRDRDAPAVIDSQLERVCFPHLARFGSNAGVLQQYEDHAGDIAVLGMYTAAPLDIAELYLANGERGAAADLLHRYAQSLAETPVNRGHLPIAKTWMTQLGFPEIAASVPD